MKIYLAGRFSRRMEFRFHAELLKNNGHEITSTWINEEGQAFHHVDKQYHAVTNFEDLKTCDCVLSFTDEGGGKGGRHVEFGIGMALGKMLAVIGPFEHTFHHYPGVLRFDTIQEFITLLKRKPNVG